MSAHFVKVVDAGAVLVNRGTYRSCDLYTTVFCRSLYAKIGSGFVKLRPRGNTSTSAKWERIDGVQYGEDHLTLHHRGL